MCMQGLQNTDVCDPPGEAAAQGKADLHHRFTPSSRSLLHFDSEYAKSWKICFASEVTLATLCKKQGACRPLLEILKEV